MSKYTTEVRFICESASGLDESAGYNSVNEIIAKALPNIFDFDFPIFDESYRSVLETKILKHFYTREIGEETVGLWKLRLDTRLNEIMPYYNKLYESELLEFNPLYTTNLQRTRDINGSNASEVNSAGSSLNVGSGSGTSENTKTDLYSDTPQGSLNGVESGTYLTNAEKVVDSATSSSNTRNTTDTSGQVTSDAHSTENYLESVVGFDGTNGSELLLKYRETFINIDERIIHALDDLFINLW